MPNFKGKFWVLKFLILDGGGITLINQVDSIKPVQSRKSTCSTHPKEISFESSEFHFPRNQERYSTLMQTAVKRSPGVDVHTAEPVDEFESLLEDFDYFLEEDKNPTQSYLKKKTSMGLSQTRKNTGRAPDNLRQLMQDLCARRQRLTHRNGILNNVSIISNTDQALIIPQRDPLPNSNIQSFRPKDKLLLTIKTSFKDLLKPSTTKHSAKVKPPIRARIDLTIDKENIETPRLPAAVCLSITDKCRTPKTPNIQCRPYG